jgi:hypothetical protein
MKRTVQDWAAGTSAWFLIAAQQNAMLGLKMPGCSQVLRHHMM